jgi:hypothetical protein
MRVNILRKEIKLDENTLNIWILCTKVTQHVYKNIYSNQAKYHIFDEEIWNIIIAFSSDM